MCVWVHGAFKSEEGEEEMKSSWRRRKTVRGRQPLALQGLPYSCWLYGNLAAAHGGCVERWRGAVDGGMNAGAAWGREGGLLLLVAERTIQCVC